METKKSDEIKKKTTTKKTNTTKTNSGAKNTKKPEVKLKSNMYNHDNEKINKRDDDDVSDVVMWGFILGFLLFFVILILIIVSS